MSDELDERLSVIEQQVDELLAEAQLAQKEIGALQGLRLKPDWIGSINIGDDGGVIDITPLTKRLGFSDDGAGP